MPDEVGAYGLQKREFVFVFLDESGEIVAVAIRETACHYCRWHYQLISDRLVKRHSFRENKTKDHSLDIQKYGALSFVPLCMDAMDPFSILKSAFMLAGNYSIILLGWYVANLGSIARKEIK